MGWLTMRPITIGFLVFLCSALPNRDRSAARAADAALRKTQNVMLITYDGLRWQEVFGGCDETLLNRDQGGGVRDVPALKSRFWRDTPEERREALLPFFWNTIAAKGQV